MLRKALILFSVVMLISTVGAFACGESTKSASADKASTGVYSCDSKDKAEIKSADASVPATAQTAAATSADVSCPYLEAAKKADSESSGVKEASVKAASSKSACCAGKSDMTKSASTVNSTDCPAASKCTKAAETVKSANEDKKEAIAIDKTVMVEEKAKSEKL